MRCERVLVSEPGSLAAWLLLSRAREQLGELDGMLEAARQARNLRPRNVDACVRLAHCLLVTGDVGAALELAAHVRDTAGDRAGALLRAGEFFTGCGLDAESHHCHLAAAEITPDDPRCVSALASSAAAVGLPDLAERQFDRLIYLDPGDHFAWSDRSMLRPQTLEDNHLANLSYVLERLPEDHPGRVPICYALAKECDDLDLLDEAFAHLTVGAAAQRRRMRYAVADDESSLRRRAEAFDPQRYFYFSWVRKRGIASKRISALSPIVSPAPPRLSMPSESVWPPR